LSLRWEGGGNKMIMAAQNEKIVIEAIIILNSWIDENFMKAGTLAAHVQNKSGIFCNKPVLETAFMQVDWKRFDMVDFDRDFGFRIPFRKRNPAGVIRSNLESWIQGSSATHPGQVAIEKQIAQEKANQISVITPQVANQAAMEITQCACETGGGTLDSWTEVIQKWFCPLCQKEYMPEFCSHEPIPTSFGWFCRKCRCPFRVRTWATK
jgi:hypothetical protein